MSGKLEIRGDTNLVSVACRVTGVKTKRRQDPVERNGSTVIKRSHATTLIAHEALHAEAMKFRRAVYGLLEPFEKTLIGRLAPNGAVEALRAAFEALEAEIETFNGQPGNPHRVVASLSAFPIGAVVDAESVAGVYRDIEEALVELRAVVLAHDEDGLKNWKRTHRGLSAFLPELNALAVTEGIKAALATREAIRARVKKGESIEDAARAEESGLVSLDAALGWLARALDSTVADADETLAKAE